MFLKKLILGSVLSTILVTSLFASLNKGKEYQNKNENRFFMCGEYFSLGNKFNNNWKKTNIIQLFNLKITEYSKIGYKNKSLLENCFVYTTSDKNKNIVKFSKEINSNVFVSIPEYLYNKKIKFLFAKVVDLKGKTHVFKNYEELKDYLQKTKNDVRFLKVIYKGKINNKDIVANLTEIYDKHQTYYKFKTIVNIKDTKYFHKLKTPYDIDIPSSYIERRNKIIGIKNLKFKKAEPVFNINVGKDFNDY
jgi:hypothetical protein